MTVTELLKAIQAAYPGASAAALGAYVAVFHARLKRHEGPALAAASSSIFASFKATTRQPFPIPVDFEKELPATSLKLPSDSPRLDFRARGDRARQLMANWRMEQGARAAAGNREILRALERMVEPIANTAAWAQSPKPVLLTRAQVREVQHRAISQERVRQHGKLPRDGATWWAQISAIAGEWGIATTHEEWAAKTDRAAITTTQAAE